MSSARSSSIARISSNIRRVVGSPSPNHAMISVYKAIATLPRPCSLQSPTTWCVGSGCSDLRPRDRSSPRPSVASSSRCPVDSPTLGDDATFTCRQSGPGPRSGANASRVSSNYRPNNLGFEVARGTPGDFQREQVTNFTTRWARRVRHSDDRRGHRRRCSSHGFSCNFDTSHQRRGGLRFTTPVGRTNWSATTNRSRAPQNPWSNALHTLSAHPAAPVNSSC
jgi:hypothetical protein